MNAIISHAFFKVRLCKTMPWLQHHHLNQPPHLEGWVTPSWTEEELDGKQANGLVILCRPCSPWLDWPKWQAMSAVRTLPPDFSGNTWNTTQIQRSYIWEKTQKSSKVLLKKAKTCIEMILKNPHDKFDWCICYIMAYH